jgi:DNA-binding transcriptional LysR family regulator
MLMRNLNDLRFFVMAVEAGGFSAAAKRLGVPKSTVSKRVAELEADLGVRLFHRTSRSFVSTDLGRDFYEHARGALIEAEAAEEVVRRRLAEPSGTVRLTASVPTAQFHLATRLPLIARTHPKLCLQVHVTDRFVDIVQEGFDIALRSHFAPLPDSGLIQRQLKREPVVLLAAPAYIETHGVPDHPGDLAAHPGLITSPSATQWHLRSADGEELSVAPKPAMFADESVVLLEAAKAALGIVCLPEIFAAAEVARGDLVRVLPRWRAGQVTTTMLMPHRRSQLPAVRAVADFIAGQPDGE